MQPVRVIAARVAAGFLALCAAAAPAAAADVQSRLHEAWQDQIAKTPVPQEGCFKAEYPSKVWVKVQCVAAPLTPYVPRRGLGAATVGNGNDYAAVAHGPITSAVGSFPFVTGVKTENDQGFANTYSLQLNSNFFSTTVCNGATNPSNCLGWQQFVYSSSSLASFIQYWLINYGNTCPPGGWMSYAGSCYRNSNAVGVPQEAITQLAHLKISGTAVAGGTDSFVTTTATKAYSTGGADSVVNLAAGWRANEFNVVGDGGGSEAVFNTGSSITVQISQKDGTKLKPVCTANDGTTGETNNLNLGACSGVGGSAPYIRFVEKN